ncbi:Fe-S oxidoreductase [Vibrio cholerae]|uniref:Radical SAM protein n=2 Tax=Vibrionaceae TaxID=641 RepID=A0A8B5ZLS4_VIBCL|nr:MULTISPECIES: radical SAM protein [Gammaproteobacteria]EGQ7674843.1 radical SAM protein [Vibrio parahaemolyticus]EGQ9417380.1 radical SAM protein [Vibrio cholerae]EGR0418260.1 radical SAM protein [Vibrio cholerae]EGR4490825.1 radical SAM protein [Vibrio cholerae]KFD89094.1 radical SAM additional 4Fe4S-binding SPASM domain protein [Vibrio cholerae]
MMEQFYFIITERCNLTCSHCIRDSSPKRNETAEASMIKEALTQIARSHPDSLVLLSGGEPTLHRHFRELLDFGLHLGLTMTINTNGVTSFFKDSTLKELSQHSRLSVQVSLDGDEAMHDAIRGPNSYRKALRTLRRLVENGVRCSVSTTVVDVDFMTRADTFIASLDTIGLAHIAIKRATYAGRAVSGIDVNGKKWNEHVYRLRALPTKTLLKIAPMYDFNRLDALSDDALNSLELPPSATNCGAGTAKVYVYTNGDVCPCTCFKDQPMGNLHLSDLDTILTKPPSFQVKHPACNACRYFKLCRGGCLGSGYQTTGTIGMPDPRCPKVAIVDRELETIAYFQRF